MCLIIAPRSQSGQSDDSDFEMVNAEDMSGSSSSGSEWCQLGAAQDYGDGGDRTRDQSPKEEQVSELAGTGGDCLQNEGRTHCALMKSKLTQAETEDLKGGVFLEKETRAAKSMILGTWEETGTCGMVQSNAV